MKFMRLGSKPDNFQSQGNIRSVGSEIASDFTVVVDGVTFYVHKFPLLCKSAKLQRLAHAEASSSNTVGVVVKLEGFPGGAEAFEMCAKFCYGVKIVVNAYNVVRARCAAEYLEMTEGAEKGNLIFKLDTFLHSYILHGWKDSIIALKSTKPSTAAAAAAAEFILPLARHLRIVPRCVRSIVSKLLVSPAAVDWSFTQTRPPPEITPCSKQLPSEPPAAHDDWWIEDIAELDIDMFADIILAVKATERMPPRLIGDALEFYTLKCLPFVRTISGGGGRYIHIMDQRLMRYGGGYDSPDMAKERQLLERIICLLPGEKGCTSCRFLLDLLKAARWLGVSVSLRNQLIRRAGLQLEEATVCDLLLVPPRFSDPPSTAGSIIIMYDVDLVQSLVEEFMMQQHQSPPTTTTCNTSQTLNQLHDEKRRRRRRRRRTRSAENINDMVVDNCSRRSSSATHGAKLRVAKLIDGYLAEVSNDADFEASKFIALAKSIPSFARPTHDGLYTAIDVYLEKHPDISKNERKKLCRLLDCKKLSMDTCKHASQNERLPLRTVVQVLFFEQARKKGGAAAAAGISIRGSEQLPRSVREFMARKQEEESQEGTSTAGGGDKWEEVQQSFEALQRDLASIKVKLSEVVDKEHGGGGSRSSVVFMEDEEEISARSHASSSSSRTTRKFLSRILWPATGGRSFMDHHHEDSNFNSKRCVKC